jgi:hypothetical protein
MDENKIPTQAAIVGFCLSFMLYKILLNGGFTTMGTLLGWVLNIIVPAAIAAGAYFGAKQLA